MKCQCIPPGELPQITRLFSTFVSDFGCLAEFYAHPPTEEGIVRAARNVKNDPSARRIVVDVLREQNRELGADETTQHSLNRLAAGAVAVVTGQQVGLFTGPAYSIYKALTAVRVASQLTAHGPDAVPVFWLATEDHDLAEINHCFWPGRRGLERLEIPVAEGTGRRVGEIPLGEAVPGVVQSAAALLEGPYADNVRRVLEECYQPERTFGSACGRLLARLFAGQGIILLDPLDARLQRQAAPIYRRALEESEILMRELLSRSKRLERLGYHAQVKVVERNTLLFLNVDGQRLPLRRRNGGFAAGRAQFSAAEMLDAIERSPEAFSANVLLRPVVQDALLPTAAYVGGPAETAYFAQAEVIYRGLLGRMPAILPRAGFTLIEPHIARLLVKYGFELRDVFHGRQNLRARMERQYLSKQMAQRFTAGEKMIRRWLAGQRRPLGKLDKTLVDALDTAARKMLYQLLRLRGKVGRAENFRTGVVDTHERQLTSALYPRHSLQERTLCLLPFLARHGPTLLAELAERATLGKTDHQVLFV